MPHYRPFVYKHLLIRRPRTCSDVLRLLVERAHVSRVLVVVHHVVVVASPCHRREGHRKALLQFSAGCVDSAQHFGRAFLKWAFLF
jgi:hypothetical protein